MKKTCFFITSLESGGTEKYLLRFLEHYKDEINATLICKSGKLGVLERNFRNTNSRIIPIKTGYLNFLFGLKFIKYFVKTNLVRSLILLVILEEFI